MIQGVRGSRNEGGRGRNNMDIAEQRLIFLSLSVCMNHILPSSHFRTKGFALALLFKPCLIDISVGHNQGYIFYRYFTFYILKYLESLKLFKVFEINASAYKGCIYLIEKYIKAVMN